MISNKPTLSKFSKVPLRSNHPDLKFQEAFKIKRYTISIQGEPQGGSNDLISSTCQKIKSQLEKTFGSDCYHVSGKVLYLWSNAGFPQDHISEVTLRNQDTSIDFQQVPGQLTPADLQKESVSNKSELLQATNVWFAAAMSTLQLKELGGSSGQFFNLDKIEGEI